MKPQQQTLLAHGGVAVLLAAIAFVVGAVVFQCLYWLRFDMWFDWTDPDGPHFPGQGRAVPGKAFRRSSISS